MQLPRQDQAAKEARTEVAVSNACVAISNLLTFIPSNISYTCVANWIILGQGHQKTPAFIHALYREAFGKPNQTPRGGFTDVGLHTGGQERDTAWPLVCAAFFQVLRNHASGFSPDVLFSKIVAYFGLYVTQVTIEQYKENNASIKNDSNAPNVLLDFGYRILRSASLKASSLSDEGLEMNHFVVWSVNLRDEILQEASIRSSLYSKSFELPDTNEGIWGTYRDYRLKIPIKDPSIKDTVVRKSVIHKLTVENLRWVNVLDEKSLAKMSMWVKKEQSKAKHDSLKSILVLKTIENAMWDCAKDLSKTLGQEQLEHVSSIIDSYRSVLHDFMSSSTHLHLSTVELRSREVLVVWVGKL